jgi:hypothetical protein
METLFGRNAKEFIGNFMKQLLKFEKIDKFIVEIRDQKVLLDADVAVIYGVTTKDINKAVANNPDKFPEGYIFSLLKVEKDELVENFHRFERLKHSTVNPKVFTEKGRCYITSRCHCEERSDVAIS